MQPWSAELSGRIDHLVIDSDQLKGNPLGDPAERPLLVYTPPGYDDEPGRRYPSVYVIMGFTGHVAMWQNRSPFRRPFPELADELFAAGQTPPAIVVYVDAWTSLGGSQYLDSPGTGKYHSYLCRDVVEFVDARYRTLADRDHRAITGKSSGGYGAMVSAMLAPEVFGALATHAGDALFEATNVRTFPEAARALRDHYDGSYDRFLADFRSRIAFTKPSDGDLIEMYAYAAAYSADPDGTVRLPFDEYGALVPGIWQRWLDWDPVVMSRREPYRSALASMRAIWIDAGTRDEYFLDLGATAFHHEVLATGIDPERVYFELFDGTHGGIEYRYPLALGWLCERLAT